MLDDRLAGKHRIVAKIRKCLELAADTRGNATMRETAWRQAQALIAKHDLQLEKLMPSVSTPAAPVAPAQGSAEWAPYWAQRTAAEAARAGVRTTVLCRDGWHVPG